MRVPFRYHLAMPFLAPSWRSFVTPASGGEALARSVRRGSFFAAPELRCIDPAIAGLRPYRKKAGEPVVLHDKSHGI
jgi:hypothetical protein